MTRIERMSTDGSVSLRRIRVFRGRFIPPCTHTSLRHSRQPLNPLRTFWEVGRFDTDKADHLG